MEAYGHRDLLEWSDLLSGEACGHGHVGNMEAYGHRDLLEWSDLLSGEACGHGHRVTDGGLPSQGPAQMECMGDRWRLTVTGTCSNGMTCSVVRLVVMEIELPPGGESWMGMTLALSRHF